mmetsp:Transcript_58637/g.189911  ORF Transcript_58637/g.189911 Transcript_58637/m.189911 type:complete len:287 (-) Transcript_58637:213-1073(-)
MHSEPTALRGRRRLSRRNSAAGVQLHRRRWPQYHLVGALHQRSVRGLGHLRPHEQYEPARGHHRLRDIALQRRRRIGGCRGQHRPRLCERRRLELVPVRRRHLRRLQQDQPGHQPRGAVGGLRRGEWHQVLACAEQLGQCLGRRWVHPFAPLRLRALRHGCGPRARQRLRRRRLPRPGLRRVRHFVGFLLPDGGLREGPKARWWTALGKRSVRTRNSSRVSAQQMRFPPRSLNSQPLVQIRWLGCIRDACAGLALLLTQQRSRDGEGGPTTNQMSGNSPVVFIGHT